MTARYRINLNVLTALAALAISSFSITASSAAPVIHCGDSLDCPNGDRCKISPHKKSGVCVRASTAAKKKSY
jgi:hypothetical protein